MMTNREKLILEDFFTKEYSEIFKSRNTPGESQHHGKA